MKQSTVSYRREPPIGWIVFGAPAKLNALNSASWRDLDRWVVEGAADPDIRVIAIMGEGGVFCAGDDIKELSALITQRQHVRAFNEIVTVVQQISLDIRRAPKPVVAVVSGWALGGGFELATACDLIFAGDSARLGMPEVGIGATVTGGVTHDLPRMIGLHKAKELAFTRKYLDAKEAFAMGIINKVMPDAELVGAVEQFASQVAQFSSVTIGLLKQQFNVGSDSTFEQAIVHESEAALASFATSDAHEGFNAFAEKRSPVFTGT